MTATATATYAGYMVLKLKSRCIYTVRFTQCADAVRYFNQHRNDRFSRWVELIGFTKRGGCVRLMFHAQEEN